MGPGFGGPGQVHSLSSSPRRHPSSIDSSFMRSFSRSFIHSLVHSFNYSLPLAEGIYKKGWTWDCKRLGLTIGSFCFTGMSQCVGYTIRNGVLGGPRKLSK